MRSWRKLNDLTSIKETCGLLAEKKTKMQKNHQCNQISLKDGIHFLQQSLTQLIFYNQLNSNKFKYSLFNIKKSIFILKVNSQFFISDYLNYFLALHYTANQITFLQNIKARMGIDGLLNLLRPLTQKQHISSFKDKTVAVDAMPWIYKGCYSCAMELNQDIESIDFLYYILEMLDMLSYYNIKPIFVFDGRAVHAKSDTLQKRKKSKQENKQKGLQFLKNNQMEQARKYLSRCIVIDQRIIAMTINALVTKNIQFIVAPYQADCQIAKLKRLGIVEAVISQDSDLIVFGVNVILKLSQNGECDYIDLNRWRPKDVNDVFLKYFLAFDQLSRIDAAILAGSDYNQSVKGIGIKRAIKLLTTQVTMNNVINKLKFKKTYMSRVPQNYEKIVQKSKLIFNLSTVFNPVTKILQFLRPQLLDQLKPQDMTIDQLLEIVGIHYGYNQEVAYGRVASKTLQKRDIKSLNFPQIFRVNKQNMNACEAMNRRRKLQQKQRKQIQAQAQSMSDGKMNQSNLNQNNDGDDYIFKQLNQFKKRAVTVLSEQQIQKRKQQRKNRISKLQQLMNTLVDVFEDSDDQVFAGNNSQDQQQIKKPIENIQQDNSGSSSNRSDQLNKHTNNSMNKNTNNSMNKTDINNYFSNNKNGPFVSKNQNQKKTAIKNSRDISQDKEDNLQRIFASEEQSVQEDLGFLNPFIKKDTTPTNIKPQHIFGSKNK